MIFLFILIIITLIFITINIKIEFIDFQYTSVIKPHIDNNYKIKVTIYIFQKIPILKTIIEKEKINNILKDEKINKLIKHEKEIITNRNYIDKDILKQIRRLNINLKEMNLKILVGTENAAITAFLIPIIATFLAMFLREILKEYNNEQIFKITPIYNNQNLINIEFSGIFQIKMIHIINTICILNNKKRKGEKNERTSNRRSYDYSYE